MSHSNFLWWHFFFLIFFSKIQFPLKTNKKKCTKYFLKTSLVTQKRLAGFGLLVWIAGRRIANFWCMTALLFGWAGLHSKSPRLTKLVTNSCRGGSGSSVSCADLPPRLYLFMLNNSWACNQVTPTLHFLQVKLQRELVLVDTELEHSPKQVSCVVDYIHVCSKHLYKVKW